MGSSRPSGAFLRIECRNVRALTAVSPQQTGLVLFILVIVQSFAGIFIKATSRTAIHRKSPGLFEHPIQGWIHVLLGVSFIFQAQIGPHIHASPCFALLQLTIVGLGFWQTYSGFDLFHKSTDRVVPLAVYIMWGALAGATVVTYLTSLGMYTGSTRHRIVC